MSDNKVVKQAKDTAKQELNEITRLTKDGAKSGAYLYPIKVRMFLMKSNMAEDIALTLSYKGHLLFHVSSLPVETIAEPAGPNHDTRRRNHNIYVLLHIPSAIGRFGLHIWTNRRTHHYTPGPQ